MLIRRTLAALAVAVTTFLAIPAHVQAADAAASDSANVNASAAPAPQADTGEIDPIRYFAPFGDKLPGTDPFSEGHWIFQVYGSGSDGKNSNAVYGGHVGIGYHFLDGVSLNAELSGEAFHMQDTPNAQGGDTAGGALDLVIRWHFIRGNGWSIFSDIGGGIQESADSFPAEGTTCNFRAQAGLGATLRITPCVYLMGGARWFHISNARIHGPDRNPSYDSVLYYVGVMVPF